MSVPDTQEIEDRLVAALDNQHLSGNWENVSIVREILGRLSVEDHLILLEEMLDTATTDADGVGLRLLRAAHQNVTAALDQVERHIAIAL